MTKSKGKKSKSKSLQKEKLKPNKSKLFLLLSLIIILTAIVFSNTIKNDFISNWDDNIYIINNPHIQNLSWNNIKTIFASYKNGYAGNYHPLTTLVYAIEYNFYGLNPKPFHILNFILHLLNVILVFQFIYLLTKKLDASVIVALFFAVHPMHVESVAWISELKDLLYSLFYLAALISYVYYAKYKPKLKYILFSFFFFSFSCFSKSMAVTLPLILILIDYFVKRKYNRKLILEKIPFFVLSIIFGLIAIYTQKASGTIYEALPFSYFDRLFLISYSIIFYIVNLLAPLKLCIVHFYPENSGMLPLEYYASLVVFLLIVWWVIKSGDFRRILIFGFLFYLASISLIIQIIPVGQFIVAERYTYIPYLGLFLIIGLYYNRISENKNAKSKRLKPYFLFILICYSLLFSFNSYNRNKVWKNGRTLFADAIEKNPEQALVYTTHGNECLDVRDYNNAILDFSKAIKLLPNYADAYHNRGVSKYNIKDYSGAIEDYNMVIKLQPKNPNGYYSRGLARYESKDNKGAIEDCNKVIELVGSYMEVYNNRGVSKGILEDYEGSIIDFDKAIEVDPNNANAYFNRGNSELLLGKTKNACEDYKKAVNLGHKGARQMLEQYCNENN